MGRGYVSIIQKQHQQGIINCAKPKHELDSVGRGIEIDKHKNDLRPRSSRLSFRSSSDDG